MTKINENDELHRIFLNEDEKGLLDFINRMNISVALKRKLISLYTNYEEHIRELFELLRPVVNAINKNSDIYSETIHKLEQRINEATDLRSYVMECAGFQLPEADSYSLYISMLSPVSITVKESEDGAPDVIIEAFLKDITDLLYAGCDCNKIAARFKILSDETRLEILHCICARPCYGLELAEIFNITAPTVSYHMNKLVFNGFVESSLEGGKVYYKPNREEIDSFLESVKKFLDSPFTKREKN